MQYFDFSGTGYIALDPVSGSGAYRISGGFDGGNTVREKVGEITDVAGDLIGNKIFAAVVLTPWKIAFNEILKANPQVADSDNEEFEDFTANIVVIGEMTGGLPSGRIGGIFAYFLLHMALLTLLNITLFS